MLADILTDCFRL